jgi:hypothetical protein
MKDDAQILPTFHQTANSGEATEGGKEHGLMANE